MVSANAVSVTLDGATMGGELRGILDDAGGRQHGLGLDDAHCRQGTAQEGMLHQAHAVILSRQRARATQECGGRLHGCSGPLGIAPRERPRREGRGGLPDRQLQLRDHQEVFLIRPGGDEEEDRPFEQHEREISQIRQICAGHQDQGVDIARVHLGAHAGEAFGDH